MDVNPFQKPQSEVSQVASDGLEGYQPFQGSSSETNTGTKETTDQKKLYQDLQKKQKELDARAAELDRQEREQAHLLNANSKINNFPPIPSFFKIKPCFYQDISLDIPPHYVNIVTRGYHLWLGLCAICLLNLCASIGYLIAAIDKTMSGSTFGSAICVFLFCPPAAYICWFRPLYHAFRTDSSINFFIFFFVMIVQVVVTIIQALGIYWLGSCGWLNGLMMLRVDKIAGGIMLLCAFTFTLLAVFEIIFLIKVHRLYRGTDASFQKAKSEIGAGAATTLLSSQSYSSTFQK